MRIFDIFEDESIIDLKSLKDDEIRTYANGMAKVVYQNSHGVIDIASVRVPQKYRRKGAARKALGEFLAATDAAGLTVKLIASSLDKKTHTWKLVRFYESLGFKITGERANALGDPWMQRDPKKKMNESSDSHKPALKKLDVLPIIDSRDMDGAKTPLKVVPYNKTAASYNDEEAIRNAPYKEFNTNDLVTEQDWISKKKVANLITNRRPDSHPAVVMNTSQGLLIYRGNHRAVAAHLVGDKFKAKYIDALNDAS